MALQEQGKTMVWHSDIKGTNIHLRLQVHSLQGLLTSKYGKLL